MKKALLALTLSVAFQAPFTALLGYRARQQDRLSGFYFQPLQVNKESRDAFRQEGYLSALINDLGSTRTGLVKPAFQFLQNSQSAPERRTIFTGTLLGQDGKAISEAQVHLSSFDQSKPFASVEVGKNGSFTLTTAKTGLLRLWLTGVNHQPRKITLFVDKPTVVGLDVRLKTYDYRDDFDEVKIIGDFNDFSFKSAKAMDRRPDGTFVAEFETSAPRFAYQLIGVTRNGASINGTQSEAYVYDGGGDYRSIVTPKSGRVRIVFDPKALVRSETPGQVAFRDRTSTAIRFAVIYEAMLERRDRLQDALTRYKKTGRPLNQFSYDWSLYLDDLSKQISAEKDPLLRQILLFSYLDLGFGIYGAKLDPAIAQRVFSEIPPTSQLWSIEPTLIGVAIECTGQPEVYKSYVQQVVNNHTDPVVVNVVKTELSPDRQIMVGKTAPAFSLASFDQPGITYTSVGLNGRIVLIDFWATWCGPCIEEMPNLHQAYEKFKGRGFEILSVSLDEKPEVVKEFRRGRWKMPWLHSLLSSNPEMKKQFEVVGIPKAVLIDRDGRIVAVGKDLRGRNLVQTLTRVMGTPE